LLPKETRSQRRSSKESALALRRFGPLTNAKASLVGRAVPFVGFRWRHSESFDYPSPIVIATPP